MENSMKLKLREKILIRISAMSLLGLGLLGFAAQMRSEYISGMEDLQFIRFPTRFSVSNSDGEVLKQVKISSGILWAIFQKK